MKKTIVKALCLLSLALAGISCCQSVSTQDAALANIMNRKSVRSFTGQKLSEEQITTLLKAAMAAPTAMNYQPWCFVVVNDEAKVAAMFGDGRGADMYFKAGAVIVVCGETTMKRSRNGETTEQPNRFWFEDCSAATENLLLAAHALGLGAVWTGAYPDMQRVAGIAQLLNCPENIVPLAVVRVGYPDEAPAPKDKFKEENISYDKFGGKKAE